jgi:diguanylate cyclase (GGDEF)-like protein
VSADPDSLPATRLTAEGLARLRAALCAAALLSLVGVAHAFGALEPLRYFLEDFRFTASRPASDSILIVQIDSPSIAEMGAWPWSRATYASLLDVLRASGAQDIALDIDLSSPSVPAADAELAHALERAGGNVILPAFRQAARMNGASGIHDSLPINIFADQAWIASVNVGADRHGKVREIAASEVLRAQVLPSLAVMLAGHTFNAPTLRIDFGISPAGIDRVSAVDVLKNRIAPERFRDKKVIIGATAIELRDFVLVPRYGFVSGPVFHALGAETLLQDRTLRSPGAAVMIGLLFAIGLMSTGLLARKNWLSTIAWVGAGSAAIEIACFSLYYGLAYQIDTSAVQCMLWGTGVLALLGEIDLSRIKIWLARLEAGNLRSILAQVVKDSLDGIIIVDENGTIEASSAQAATLLQLGTLAPGQHIQNCLPRELSRAVLDALSNFRSGQLVRQRPTECLLSTADSLRILEYLITPSKVSRRKSTFGKELIERHVACLTFRDITEQRQLEQETFRLAHFDQLTGLPNRNSLEKRFKAHLRNGESAEGLAVMLLDIDRFRSINKTLGHDYGDMLLRAVAARLSSALANIKFAAHLGGDDFALLIGDGTTREEFAEVANLIVVALNEPYTIERRQLHISFSAGVYICPPAGTDAMEAVMMADNALLAAKQSGGGICAFHDEATAANLAKRQELELELWDALDDNQFTLVYQPQVMMTTGRIVGVEALLRWNHPVRGLISPSKFIPIAEVTGLILPLGRFALEQACRDAAQWSLPCKVAVNLSILQMSRADIVAEVETALAKSGLSGSKLELEVTEGALLQEMAHAARIMHALEALGITFSIDDFGTGYSSLGYLASFPFDRLKLDSSFVAKLESGEKERAIVATVAALARQMNLELVAEGVENMEQARILHLLGYRVAQGYWFGRPQTSSELDRLLREQNADMESDKRVSVRRPGQVLVQNASLTGVSDEIGNRMII